MKVKQDALFDINELELNPQYISPVIKRKWSMELRKYFEKRYEEKSEQYGDLCCGYGKICDYCNCKHLNGCQDCIYATKEFCKKNKIEIDYSDFDFDKLFEKVW